MKKEDKIERGRLAQLFVTGNFYRKYFRPHIEEEIRNASDIKKIDENDIERSYLKQKIKADIYRGILNKLDTWIKEGEKLKKEVK